jgi:hypothetical protein
LRISSSPDFETKSSYSVRIRTTDQGSLLFEKQFTISINDLNESPTDLTLSALAINENVPGNSTVGTFTSTDADAGNTFIYTLVAGTGSTDNASFNISSSSLRISASPDFETKSSYSVRIRTTDQGSLLFEKQFTISINDLNESPTDLTLSASAINENVPGNSTVGTLTSTDADAGNTFIYTLVAGTGSTDNASFNISGSSLRISASPDFETKSSYSVRIRTTDQGSLFFEKQFTISINDIAEAGSPSVNTVSATAISETSATLGGNVTTDGGATVTDRGIVYNQSGAPSIADNKQQIGSGTGAFSQSITGLISGTTYFVRAYATNSSTTAYGNEISFTTITTNHAPTDITLSNSSMTENISDNSIVGSLTSTDQDLGNTQTYSLVSGVGDDDNSSFNINGASLRITSSPNFEIRNSYSIRLRTTDDGNLIYEKSFVITITNVNETPTDISLSSLAIDENVAANTEVGNLSTQDPDASDTFTYTLIAGAGSTDNASFSISGTSLRIVSTPDFETKNLYSIRIQTTDSGNLMYEKQISISVNDIAEALPPTVRTSLASSVTSTAAILGGEVTADGGANVTERGIVYNVVGNPTVADIKQSIGSGLGSFTLSVADLSASTTYYVRAYAINSAGTSYGNVVSFTTAETNIAPNNILLSNSSINENITANSTVGELTSTDANAANIFTYTLATGTGSSDNGSFNINGATLRVTNSPDFESISSYSIRIRTCFPFLRLTCK